jgi:two-component system NtrC family sensor kinase
MKARTPGKVPMAKKRILVVDDENAVAVLAGRYLQALGYELAGIAMSADEAVSKAHAELPDLVLMDIALDGTLDGIDAARRIRESLDIPVVFITGAAGGETVERAKSAEPMGYILKPFRPEDLRATIETALYQFRASRARSREAVRRIEEKYRAIFENLTEGAYQSTPAGQLVAANPAFARMLGYESPEELMAATLDIPMQHYLEPARRRELLESLERNGAVRKFEVQLRRKDGTPIWASLNVKLMRDAEGKISYLAGVAEDITDKKRAEEALRESQARLACVVDSAQDGIVMIDRRGRVTLWSPAAERIIGYSAAEVTGRNLHELLVPPRLRDQHAAGFARWQADGTGAAVGKTLELPCLRKDGTEICVELSLSSVRLHDGWSAVGIVRDVTERKKAEEERRGMEIALRHAQKLEAVGRLAAGIAHEINTPTQYVGDNVRFLGDALRDIGRAVGAWRRLMEAAEKGPVAPELLAETRRTVEECDLDFLMEEAPRAVEQTLEGVERIAVIVRAMKEFSHPGPQEMTAVDLRKAIESTLVVCRNEYKYVADVETEFDDDLPPVQCLPGEINQVVLNLIVNAAHAIAETLEPGSGRKGTIRIAVRRDGDWAEMRISDTGSGIPEDVRPRIFEPFFTTKEVGKGTGQGLAIAYNVITVKHKGTITFETAVGKGTTFIIRLPIEQEVCAPREAH